MDKTTFLEELEKSLHVLKEEEIRDIIDEYEQHIDMKVKNGQTEEQAIADFGTVRELATEILEAYHVRADDEVRYVKEEPLKKSVEIKEGAKKLQERTRGVHTWSLDCMMRIKAWLCQIGNGINRGCSWCKKQAAWPFEWRKHRRQQRFAQSMKEEAVVLQDEKNRKIEGKKQEISGKREPMKIGQSVGRACKKIWDAAVAMLRWCIRMFWNFCVFGTAGILGIFELMALYVEGVLVVLLLKGYPLAGVSVGGFGVILSLLAAIGICFGVRKRSFPKLFLGVIAAGVLLAGIGTGTALIEYSTFQYGGEIIIGEENFVTETLEYHLDEEIEHVFFKRVSASIFSGNMELMEDNELQEGVIQCDVTYNKKVMRPFLWEDDWNWNGTKQEGGLILGIGIDQISDEFVTFMEYKDRILDELKQKKLSSYRTAYVSGIVIRVNPEMMSRIAIDFY